MKQQEFESEKELNLISREVARKQLNVKGKRVKMLILTRFYPFKHMFNRVF